ncbi:hypothetical protein [Pseudomonas sp.]|uniref:hypothetical protein n=1 Tax=Pseudomonas sp. TaxID=306 RepID=UPI004053D175
MTVRKPLVRIGGKVRQLPAGDELAGLIFTKEFVSPEQTITAGGALTIAHDLGVKPKDVKAYLVVKTAFSNWALGDEIFWKLDYEQANATPFLTGFTCKRHATNLIIRFASGGIWLHDANAATYVAATTIAANCKIVFEAWA